MATKATLMVCCALLAGGCSPAGRSTEQIVGLDQSGLKQTPPKPWATWCVTFSPDSQHLAASRGPFVFHGRAGASEGEVCVWQTQDWKPVDLEVPALTNHPTGLAFSSDGKELLTCADAYSRNPRGNPMNGSEVFAWSWPDGKLKDRYHNKENGAFAAEIHLHPDAKLVAVARSGGKVLMFYRDTGEVITLEGSTGNTESLSFHPDGKSLVLAQYRNEVIRQFDSSTGKETAKLSLKKMEPISIKHSVDGKLIAVGCKDGSLRLIDEKLTKELWASTDAKRNERIRSVAFTPDGKTIAASSGDEVWLCDAMDGSTKQTLKAEFEVMSVAISPDGKMLAAGLSDKKHEHGCVMVRDLSTGQLLKTLE
jgi:WD40 repeat protein